VYAGLLGTVCLFFVQSHKENPMKNEAGKAVEKKLAGVESEQGSVKEVGSEPPKNYGHDSAKSEGVSGSIPKES
jgi:hypothetical protein